MGENSKIEWTHHTFNPWWGCSKQSPACDNCYAIPIAARFGTGWGPTAPRRFFDDNHWEEPRAWDRKAARLGVRHRVFCASMADVFEDYTHDIETQNRMNGERDRLWRLIEQTPNLDWMLLTKRPQNVLPFVANDWRRGFPANVWMGATVETQEWADKRIPELLKVPASVRFLSCEPLLGPVDLSAIRTDKDVEGNVLSGEYRQWCDPGLDHPGAEQFFDGGPRIHWVIVGGESGPYARPTHPDWFRSLRDQCHDAGVPYFLKQWGEWYHTDHVVTAGHKFDDGQRMWRLGKKAAGRLLGGREWNEFPTTGAKA